GQGVRKATGLHPLLDMLRLSAHNTVAIGDAENDHELLRLAEIGAAVEWGSAALRAAADTIVAGTDPSAVAAYIRALARAGAMPRPPRARRRLRLGYTEAGREFSLAAHGRNVLIAGDAKSGKSWVAGLLCEQLILHGYCVCVLDPEGDYASLEGLPGVAVLGGADPPPSPRDLARALRFPDRSVVIDLSRLPQDQKIEYVRGALPVINEVRRRTGLPHRVVVDEAHYFLHEPDVAELLDLELNGYTFVTYWASRLPPALLAATEVIIVTRETSAAEIEALRKWCGPCGAANGERWAMLTRLETSQALALPVTAETHGELVMFTLGPRMTAHVRHREKYVDVPVSEDRAFVFAGDGPSRRVRTLRRFVAELERPAASLAGHLTRGDFSRWVGDVFGDHALADDLRAIEQAPGATADPDVPARMANAVRARYDLAGE
ncbi:MAG: HAD hydrolase family protein, partial [Vicinamibacterales bacterium]